MNNLRMFGFPVSLDMTEVKLVPGEDGIGDEGYNRKFSKAMFGLLEDDSYRKENEAYYDFYRAIGRDAERHLFGDRGLRYDCTVIMPGQAGDEFKKTSGHFHCEIPGKGMSYPEYYQVCRGTALFIMQKVKDACTEGRMCVEDCLLAVVHEGEAIVVPPEYGHCTVNIGEGPMVFINLVADASKNYYDSVKRHHGMCCYINSDGKGGFDVVKNARYDFDTEPKMVRPGQSAVLGIYKDAPVYNVYLAEPEKFDYLLDPAPRMNDYFELFR